MRSRMSSSVRKYAPISTVYVRATLSYVSPKNSHRSLPPGISVAALHSSLNHATLRCPWRATWSFLLLARRSPASQTWLSLKPYHTLAVDYFYSKSVNTFLISPRLFAIKILQLIEGPIFSVGGTAVPAFGSCESNASGITTSDLTRNVFCRWLPGNM